MATMRLAACIVGNLPCGLSDTPINQQTCRIFTSLKGASTALVVRGRPHKGTPKIVPSVENYGVVMCCSVPMLSCVAMTCPNPRQNPTYTHMQMPVQCLVLLRARAPIMCRCSSGAHRSQRDANWPQQQAPPDGSQRGQMDVDGAALHLNGSVHAALKH